MHVLSHCDVISFLGPAVAFPGSRATSSSRYFVVKCEDPHLLQLFYARGFWATDDVIASALTAALQVYRNTH